MQYYSYDRTAAEPDGFRIDPEIAWAYADAWPAKTLTNPYLRPAVAQKVKEISPYQADTILWSNKHLVNGWQNNIALMTDVCPRYNEFYIKRVAKFLLAPEAKGIRIQAAREYSVALYIEGEPEVLGWLEKVAEKGMKADDANIQGNVLRLWWD